MKKLILLGILLSLAPGKLFAQHGAHVAADPNPGEQYNVYRGAVAGGPYVLLNPAPLAVPDYQDVTATQGATVFYVMTGVLGGAESLFSAEVSAAIPGTPPPPPPPAPPPPPPPATCTAIAVGCRIKVTATANIRHAPTSATALPALYGTEPAGALGTVLAISPFGYAPFGVPHWVQVQFDTCSAAIPGCIGWMGSDNMTVVNTAPPPPPPPPPPPTLKMTCTPAVNANTCVITTTNIAAGTAFSVTFTEGGLSATASGTSK